MLKITKSDEPLVMNTLCILLYGEPGAGKSSLGFSAHNPITFDFDKGAHRSEFRKDIVQIGAWSEIAQVAAEDLADYDTVVVDTIGRALDTLTVHVGGTDPKNLRRGSSNLSLQGWGELKSEFTSWIDRLRSFGKSVVLIAHDKIDKSGDDDVHRPDVQGGSYGEVLKVADMVGFLSRHNDGAYIDFDPATHYVGKNSAQLERVKVPHLSREPEFFGSVINRSLDAINGRSAASKAVADTVAEWRERIDQAADPTGINDLIGDLKGSGLEGAAFKQVRALIASRAKGLGLVWSGNGYAEKEAA